MTSPFRNMTAVQTRWLQHFARHTPDSVALDSGGHRITYANLAAQVRGLASQLQNAGLTPGDRVGLAADRSWFSVVAVLAAVEARLPYVPLDLSYPPERLRQMLSRSDVRVVLGTDSALASLRDTVGHIPTLLDPAPPPPCAESSHGAELDATYVLFTSGSTGSPKGVVMGPRPLEHLVDFHARHPRLGQPARTLQFAPLSFDVHFQEIFSTLACGGTLVLLAEKDRRDPVLLNAALRQQRVERVFLPYVALQMLAEAAADDPPTSLRDVISAGEQLQITPAIRRLFTQLTSAELHNHYGPTETHVVTAHELRGDPQTWPRIPPIGRPLPHVKLACRAHVAQASGAPELLIGGDALAHGYLGSAELTAERFLADVPELPGRWFATGDLVQQAPDGVWDYLGRADQQLKVDGFRIEPGEIELALMNHPLVKDAVVTAPVLPQGRQLVAHVVLRAYGGDPSWDHAQAKVLEPHHATALRQHLRANLPEYMVPMQWVSLKALPTTPSGKIDRGSLPQPGIATNSSRAPNTPAEQLRDLWRTLLGRQDISDHDNLFDLGARSLMVLRFVAQAQALGLNVSAADVYDRPTLNGLIQRLQGPGPRPTQAKQAHSQKTENKAR